MVLELTTNWKFVSDAVMGGVSKGAIRSETIAGREATHLTGDVSLENNGGFVQMALDLNDDCSDFDASGFEGIEIEIIGNGETYDLRLRTSDLAWPWQSFRASFLAPSTWKTVSIPFDEFMPNKSEALFNPRRLRRIGILGIGREFNACVAISKIRFINS